MLSATLNDSEVDLFSTQRDDIFEELKEGELPLIAAKTRRARRQLSPTKSCLKVASPANHTKSIGKESKSTSVWFKKEDEVYEVEPYKNFY